MSTIRGIHHVQITIPRGSEELARTFYCELLGLQEVEKPVSLQGRGGFWLQSGSQQIHVGTEDGVERLATKAHIAYAVDDIETWKQRLAEQGFAILDGIPIPGYTRFETRDPFGNRMEFIQAL
ncbi:VOC family protein [Tengunoibacter tsumagoiensis]|uniref:Glyoxalase n=1 Tax=Tengunoibacter tsumagoiensis TaxID=2014871 RepID=A0A401ZYB0_9CHLR|nr:VOC family protein [Tengunoibacter tsumagoiensis]GCE11848.1 glyoxalase [Tengunoibacter tsumagoiensis]